MNREEFVKERLRNKRLHAQKSGHAATEDDGFQQHVATNTSKHGEPTSDSTTTTPPKKDKKKATEVDEPALCLNWHSAKESAPPFKELAAQERELVIAAVQQGGRALQFVPTEHRGDKAVVLAAVREDGRALKYASRPLQQDLQVVLCAVVQDARAIKYAYEELREHPRVVRAAYAQLEAGVLSEDQQTEKAMLHRVHMMQLRRAREEHASLPRLLQEEGPVRDMLHRLDQDMASLVSQWRPPPCVSEAMQQEKESLMMALQHDGMLLEFAPLELKGDPQVVLAAVQQEPRSLQFATEELCSQRRLVLAAVRCDGCSLEFASPTLRGDPEVAHAAVEQDPWSLEFVSEACRGKELVLAAVQIEGRTLMFAPEELKRDKQVVLASAAQDVWALKFMSSELKADPAFALQISNSASCDPRIFFSIFYS